jgi:hypothetical protein
MKRDPLQEYRALLATVYGAKPQRMSMQRSKPTLIAMSFDDGGPIRVTRAPRRSLGYSASTAAQGEYDVAADNPRFDPLAYQASRDQIGVCGAGPDGRPVPMTLRNGSRDAPRQAPPAREADPEAVTSSPQTAQTARAGASAFTQRRMRELVGDKELLSDIQSILDKKPDAIAPQPAAPMSERSAARPPEPPAPRQEPSEHAIFDRIARNMQYATAYDLGPVELGRRFDAFDQAEQLPVLRAPNTR